MGVQKEQESTFLTAFEHREKSLAACLLHNIFIAVVSELEMARAANGPDFGRAAEVERAGRSQYF